MVQASASRGVKCLREGGMRVAGRSYLGARLFGVEDTGTRLGHRERGRTSSLMGKMECHESDGRRGNV